MRMPHPLHLPVCANYHSGSNSLSFWPRSMLHVVLFEPEIPPNTGNLIRLCANTGFSLDLIEPLGFNLEEKALRRAGLDYREAARINTWPCWNDCIGSLIQNSAAQPSVYACTTKGDCDHVTPRYRAGDVLLFGPESRGLPEQLLTDPRVTGKIRIPMVKDSRSLNLSNAVSIVVFEAWRQLDFAGGH